MKRCFWNYYWRDVIEVVVAGRPEDTEFDFKMGVIYKGFSATTGNFISSSGTFFNPKVLTPLEVLAYAAKVS